MKSPMLHLVVVAPQVVVIVATDVEIHQLVDVPFVESRDLPNRIAEHLVDAERLAPHQQSILQEQDRNQADFQRNDSDSLITKLRSTWRPDAWLFSG